MSAFLRACGIDLGFIAFWLLTVFIAAACFSVLLVAGVATGADLVMRVLNGTLALFGFALLTSPVTALAALAGWACASFTLHRLSMPDRLRAAMAGAVAGLCAMLPVAWIFDTDSVFAAGQWRGIVIPLLWIVPASGAAAALILHRYRP